MIIYKVNTEHVQVLFPHVSHLLDKALKRNVGEIDIIGVYDLLLSGIQSLWLGLNETNNSIELAFTTEVVEYKSGQKHLKMHLVGAEDHTIKNWFNSWEKPVEQYCRDNGIDFIETFCRDGWLKYLQPLDYKKYYTVLIKDVKGI